MKKVAIITYCHWKSIGSILQSYALSRTLESCGFCSELWLEEWNRTLRYSKCTTWGLAKAICRIPWTGKIRAAHRKRMTFISEHINVRYFREYRDFVESAQIDRDTVYLAGSDQIWNPSQCSPLYYLDFVDGSKRVSYAASMGNTKIPPEKAESIGRMLREFAGLSVRENACAEALGSLTHQDISVHVDPTLLLETEAWRSLEHPRKEKEPYILVYMLYWDKESKEKIIALKRRTCLAVYAICPDVSRVFADKHLYDVGVEEFLWLIDHAEYVVTSSFHGVALSIIFRKKFAAVVNPQMPSRIENILSVLSVPLVGIDELDSVPFEYEAASLRIKLERERSIQYLKSVIR